MHQVSLITLLNGAANSVLAISALHLLLRVFGHENSPIWKKPWAAFLCKLATTVTVCGAVSNILTFSTPVWTEFILNVGVSLNFLWISFYYGYKKPVNRVKKVRQSPSRKSTNKRST
jgi:hypothetical protein